MDNKFLRSPKVWKVGPPLVPPTSLDQQNSNPNFRRSASPPIASRPNSSLPPELMPYDTFEKKSVQQLLYESAQAQSYNDAKTKWGQFTAEVKKLMHNNKYSKHLVKNLDDTKQWAALHYAVFNNNTYVYKLLTYDCKQLTDDYEQLTHDYKHLNHDYKQLIHDNKVFRCDINILTGNGENALHIAARSKSLWKARSPSSHSIEDIVQRDPSVVRLPEIIDKLIKHGAQVNHSDDEGRTPLHLAVMENRLPLVECLLENEANLYARTKLNANVLHFTFIPNANPQTPLSDMFGYITKKLESSTTEWSFPWRDKQNNLALMRTLDNRTPLTLAVCHPGITENIIRNLLGQMKKNPEDFFDQVSTEQNLYQTQIFIAIDQVAKRQLKTYDHLLPICEDCDANMFNQLFHFPCRHNNLNLLKWLIEQCSKPNDGTTRSIPASVKLDLNQTNHAGYTPLLTAVFYGSTECVKYLLQHPSTSARTNPTTTSLSVKINQTNADGENILHICAKHPNRKDLFDIIWDSAVKLELPKYRDNNGNLPLHVAARNIQEYMCDKLLNAFKWSTDPLRMKNNQGQTAAHVATVAVPYRIGPERDYIYTDAKEKHDDRKASKEKHDDRKANKEEDDDQKASKEEDDDEHDFGLSILILMRGNPPKDVRLSGLSEKDDDRKTCLHLAAANGHIKTVKFLVEKVGLEIDAMADRRLTPLHLACENGWTEIVAYLIENAASTTFRSAELYNSLEIAIINQKEDIVKELLTLPNWRELMRNAQPIYKSEAYDTPMRKLIRYLPQVAVWMIEKNLTRSFGGQGKHVFKKVYDYEFYMDIYSIKPWHRKDIQLPYEEESLRDRWHRRGCTALYCYSCGCQPKSHKGNSNHVPYTDDAYTLVRNHPLIIASEQSQCPALVEHPYNTFLRDQLFRENGYLFYIVRGIAFFLYAAFLAIWTAIILLGKHPQYFFEKTGRNMTLDLDSCANVSRTLTTANDSEALKYTAYTNLKYSLYAFLILFVVENTILILALFPRIFRTIDYILEISTFVLTFVYIYDWYDWQSPVIFRCPIQYQIGSMGLLLAWLSMLTYVKRTTWFDMGVFVAMIQVIGYKFIRFIPVLLVIVCGFGFTHWMLLQNQAPFQTPVQAVVRTGILMFDLNYEDHLYNNPIYYDLIFVVTVLTVIIFSIFILNLLISVAVGEMPSLTAKGQIWQSQMLYDLLSDYSIVLLQIMRLINYISCGAVGDWPSKKQLHPITIREHDLHGTWLDKGWKYAQMNFFDEKIQDDIIPNITSDDTKKDDK